MKRKIVAITGARSEYDIISPVLQLLQKDSEFELSLIVTGSHLSQKFGYTVKFIEEDGYTIASRIDNLVEKDDKISRILSIGNQINPLAKAISKIEPDIIFVAGDREEAITTTMVGAFLEIPVAHLAGGDIVKDGNIDNSIRYSASKFAHIHFTLLSEHNQNLIRLGEDEWRIFHTGNPALDKFIQTRHITKFELSRELNFDIENEDYLLVVYHPIITEYENEGEKVKNLLDALKETGLKCIINSPNSDAGHDSIIQAFEKVKDNPNFYFFKNLKRDIYVNLMRHAKCMVGNSSSGLIEAPSVKLPVVNTGSRQVGRVHADNVKFSSMEKNEILKNIEYWMNDNNRIILNNIINPYGDGNSSSKIIKIFKDLEINSKLIHKNITY